MANVKTAISIAKPLFEEIEALAEELDVSRSYLFSLAVREFIEGYRSQRLLEAIDAANDDFPDADEEEVQRRMRAKHRNMVKGQW